MTADKALTQHPLGEYLKKNYGIPLENVVKIELDRQRGTVYVHTNSNVAPTITLDKKGNDLVLTRLVKDYAVGISPEEKVMKKAYALLDVLTGGVTYPEFEEGLKGHSLQELHQILHDFEILYGQVGEKAIRRSIENYLFRIFKNKPTDFIEGLIKQHDPVGLVELLASGTIDDLFRSEGFEFRKAEINPEKSVETSPGNEDESVETSPGRLQTSRESIVSEMERAKTVDDFRENLESGLYKDTIFLVGPDGKTHEYHTSIS